MIGEPGEVIHVLREIRDAVLATNERVDQTNERLEAVRAELKEELGVVRTELKEELGVVRTELKEELGVVRTELKEELGVVRTELKEELGVVRTELKKELGSLRRRMTESEVRLATATHELASDTRELTGVIRDWRREHRRDTFSIAARVTRIESHLGLGDESS